ncbi:MAG: 3-dehydroquinate synthase [Burkholderiales bacterium]
MNTLQVGLGERTYPIFLGRGLLGDVRPFLAVMPKKKAVIVTNTTLSSLYLESFRRTITSAGVEVSQIVIPDGEEHKSFQTLNLIYDALLASGCERKTSIIALGGGVVGDIAGFAAATYLRGVPFIQVPTTLLSQVDSSVGGKTAINHPLGKNIIGAFYQPQLVVADTATLDTLPERELSAGLAEVVKYGLIMDLPFLEWLEDNMDRLLAREPQALEYAIFRSCQNKATTVESDEREGGQRAILNLGHTFGHAIETGLGHGTWLHGEAVAAGCVLAARMSARMGFLAEQDVERVSALIERARLPSRAPDLGVRRYLELMSHDKKVEDGRVRLVLLKALGKAFVTSDYGDADLEKVLSEIPAHV